MNKIFLVLGLTGALTLSVHAQAQPINFTTQLNNYGGDGAYVALYLTDVNGKYQKTLWISGKKSKYYKHLRDWARGSGLKAAEYDGISGASITSGETFTHTLEVDDAFIDAGYQLRIDTAVEDMRENRAEIIVPLTRSGAGQVVSGRGYVRSFTYDLK